MSIKRAERRNKSINEGGVVSAWAEFLTWTSVQYTYSREMNVSV